MTRKGKTRRWQKHRTALGVVALIVLACLAVLAVFHAPDVVSDEELAAVRAQLDEAARSNRAQGCQRPVLRGVPSPGSGTKAFVSAIEGNRACRVALEQRHKVLDALTRPDQPPSVWSRREVFEIALGAADPPELHACDATLTQLIAASQHEGVCGRLYPDNDEDLFNDPDAAVYDSAVFRLTKVVAAQANERWNRYEERQAFERLLDGSRLSQDSGRASNLLEAVMSVASFEFLGTTMERFLNDATRNLDPALLGRVVLELSRLIEGEPDLHDTFIVEARSLFETAPRERDAVEDTDSELAEVLMRLHILALGQFQETLQAACPPGVFPATCLEGFQALRDELGEGAGVQESLIQTWRQGMTEYFLRLLLDTAVKYVGRLSVRLFLLQMASLHASVRLKALSEGCPAELPRSLDPLTGEALLVAEISPGHWELRSPMGLGKELHYRIRCVTTP